MFFSTPIKHLNAGFQNDFKYIYSFGRFISVFLDLAYLLTSSKRLTYFQITSCVTGDTNIF